jgi:hypothetical protein
MNQFVNPNQRGFDLPEGCKDLMDVIRQPWLIQATGSTKGERFSEPDYSPGTFGHIEFHVSRLFMSAAQVRFLTIACSERKVVISLMFCGETLGVTLFLDGGDVDRETAVRALFAESGDLPTMDSVASTAGAPSRLLRFPLPASAPKAAEVTADALRKGFGLAEDSKLFFYYHEMLPA